MKPDWKKGDVLARPNDIAREAVMYGCSVFVAKHDPHLKGIWKYGSRPASEVRLATQADINRLMKIHLDNIKRGVDELLRLQRLSLTENEI
jgi:hypothetical protein